MEHVTLLLGAGFSQSLGIPGTQAISELVDGELTRFGSPFIELRERLKARFECDYNFEALAAALEVCGAYEAPSYLPTPPYRSVIPDVAVLSHGLNPKLTSEMYEVLMQVVMRSVTVDWKASIDGTVLGDIQRTIDGLRGIFTLNIATLNYDQGVENFVPDAIDGFTGDDDLLDFYPGFFLGKPGNKIGHLHGSSLFAFPEARYGIMKMRDLERFRRHRLWTRRLDASYYSAVITGASKPEKLTMPPYNFYYNWLANELLRSPRLLVVGYGAADPHINVWLAHAAQLHGNEFRSVFIDKFELIPPAPLLRLIGISEGFSSEREAQPTFDGITFNNGVAQLKRSLVISTGLPLTSDQSNAVLTFLTS